VFKRSRIINSMRSLTTPRLVLLPGLDGTGALFKPLVDAIGSRAATTIISYSSPEISRYADCRVVVERSLPCDEPYVLVGESFSGPVAVSIAAERPAGLVGLVLAASFVSSPRAVLKWFSACIPLLPAPHRGRWMAETLLLGRHSTPALRQLLNTAIAGIASETAGARLQEIARVDVAQKLKAVRVPILYLRARRDRLVPSSCGDGITQISPRVTLEDVEAPHMLLQCEPDECARMILKFAEDCRIAPAHIGGVAR
jgi:pimeloyl-ACP methyl ester carboxylesterase